MPLNAPVPAHTRSLARGFDLTLDLIATAGFAAMLVITALQVAFRYVLNLPLEWTEEAARVLFVITMFFGIAIAIREKEHVVVDFLFNRFPARGRFFVGLLFETLVVLLLAVIARGTYVLAIQNWDSRLLIIDWVTNGEVYLVQLIATLIMIWYVLRSMGRGISDYRAGRAADLRIARAESEI